MKSGIIRGGRRCSGQSFPAWTRRRQAAAQADPRHDLSQERRAAPRALPGIAGSCTRTISRSWPPAQGKSRSRYVRPVPGETLLEAGKPEPALNHLERFAADESVEARLRAQAKALSGCVMLCKKNMQKADEVWSGLDKTDPEIKAALAAAYCKAGLKDRKPRGACGRKPGRAQEVGRRSVHAAGEKRLIAVYAAAGLVGKGTRLLRQGRPQGLTPTGKHEQDQDHQLLRYLAAGRSGAALSPGRASPHWKKRPRMRRSGRLRTSIWARPMLLRATSTSPSR